MSLTLFENESTTNNDAERACPRTRRLLITVSNNQATITIGKPGRPGAPDWQPPAPYSPAFYGLDRHCDAIRVRSTLPGTPAVVTIIALGEQDVG